MLYAYKLVDMEIKVNLDVSTLSAEEKIALVQKIFESDKDIQSKVTMAIEKKNDIIGISENELKKIVNEDFERYDEVFKALA